MEEGGALISPGSDEESDNDRDGGADDGGRGDEDRSDNTAGSEQKGDDEMAYITSVWRDVATKYEISNKVVGSGGFGEVRDCYDKKTTQVYVVKTIFHSSRTGRVRRPASAILPCMMRRFETELDRLPKAKHNNSLKQLHYFIYETSILQCRLFFVLLEALRDQSSSSRLCCATRQYDAQVLWRARPLNISMLPHALDEVVMPGSYRLQINSGTDEGVLLLIS